jgi:CRISPR type III-B/RAMP module-associated protein Cmr5
MQNLEQRRAAHALTAAGRTDKASVARLPGMILTNGLLATLAFACEPGKENRGGQLAAADALATHLAALVPELAGVTTGAVLAQQLTKSDALTLQRATTEALAYLCYLKRYSARKE